MDNLTGDWIYYDTSGLTEYGGYASSPIVTDDGVPRMGIPYSPSRQGEYPDPDPSTPGLELHDRPQSEWELPPTFTLRFSFEGSGRYSHLLINEVAKPQTNGYVRQTHFETGTYAVNGNILTLTAATAQETVYKDTENAYSENATAPAVSYYILERVVEGGVSYLQMIPAVKQADGSFVRQSEFLTLPTIYRGAPLSPEELLQSITRPSLAPPPLPPDPINPDPIAPPPRFRRIQGTNRSEDLIGTGGSDELIGLGGNDELVGKGGSDLLRGGSGYDLMFGGAGSDILWGGSSTALPDFAYGGAGRDTFVLERGTGFAFVQDFRNGQDKLALAPGVQLQDVRVEQSGRNTVVYVWNDQVALLKGVRARQISAADFISTNAIALRSDLSSSADPFSACTCQPGGSTMLSF